MAKSPLELIPTRKPRDDAYTQKMNEYYAKRKALLDSKDDKHGYLGPEWNALSDEIRQFREGYEPSKIYSPREYLLENDLDEFQLEDTRDDVSLEDIWNAMQNGEDFYKYASVNGEGFDSAVREKIFSGMSDRLGLDYDDIYDTWLYGKKKPKVVGGNSNYNVDNGNPNPKKYVSKFATKYPDRYKAFKSHPIVDNLSDEEIDEIARGFGIDLD